jgi:hypothetical protein
VKHAPEYDFKPIINENSKKIAAEIHTGSQRDVSQRLYNLSLEKQEMN